MGRYPILDGINSPQELKALPEELLPPLCQELREMILETVSQNGGHLASNLGVVELTVALHRVFSTPEDAISARERRTAPVTCWPGASRGIPGG